MGDAEVEGAAHDRAAGLERPIAAEVLPQPERDGRQQQAAAAAAAVDHALVAIGGGRRRSCCSLSVDGLPDDSGRVRAGRVHARDERDACSVVGVAPDAVPVTVTVTFTVPRASDASRRRAAGMTRTRTLYGACRCAPGHPCEHDRACADARRERDRETRGGRRDPESERGPRAREPRERQALREREHGDRGRLDDRVGERRRRRRARRRRAPRP